VADTDNQGESRRTLLVALAANAAIAAATLVGGLIAGSSAMLSEPAHSVADTMNQVFLDPSLRRARMPAASSSGRRAHVREPRARA